MGTTRLRGAIVAVIAAVGAVGILIAVGDPANDEAGDLVTVAAPDEVYDPVSAGEALPVGYRVGLSRDQIEPVYEPTFTSPSAVDWPADMLVIGVAGDSTAKAYPVTHLNSREMVVDSLEGIPILVTW